MIITGWQSCKYSIFYLASLTYRAMAMGGCRCCSAPSRRGGSTWPGHGRQGRENLARARSAARAARRARLRRPGASRGVASKPDWPNGTAAMAACRGLRGARRGTAGGVGCMVRAVGAQGCGRRPEKTMNMMSMEELAGKEKTKLGKASNGHGVEKRKTRRRRGRRGLPSSGGGCRRERTRWPEKLAGNSPET